MAKEKISDANKKAIANMNLRGKQFGYLADVLNVSESTARKADKLGKLMNTIEDLECQNHDLEYQNRLKDVQIALSQSPMIQPFKKSKHN